jgi:large subunit ribosomal protein L20
MSRVKGGVVTHRRHKKLLKQTKGFWQQRSNIYRRAHETLMRSWAFAFKSRRLKKRDMRSLFIVRVGAAARQHEMSYNVFMYKLKIAQVVLNRKMLSQLAILEPTAFAKLAQLVQNT